MKLVILAGLTSAVFAGQSFYNILDEETGDFGGNPFPFRSEFSTFIETDANDDVVAYGFYMPQISKMGIESLGQFDLPLGAALDFDKSGLKDPSQLPFEFVGINYNPVGHPSSEYLIPHFDIHMWLYPNEFARGIECDGTGFPPCLTTEWLAARFNNTIDPAYFPPGYNNDVTHWVPSMGAHIVPMDPPDDFADVPAAIVGSYLGRVIYHEPMVSNDIFFDSEALGSIEFPWPALKYPTAGRYFTNLRIEYESSNQRYKVIFNNLVTSPEEHRGTPVFIGAQKSFSTPETYTGSVSGSKNCLINSGSIIDGGYMVNSGGMEYCCRAKGSLDGSQCLSTTCGVPDFMIPSDPDAYFFNSISGRCYGRCVSRV